jgi:hypothetical protein
LSSPSSPRSHFASKLKLKSSSKYLAEIPDSESPTSLYSRGLDFLDGSSLSKPGGSADELQGLGRRVPVGRCWNEVVRARRDIEGLERELEGLRGEMREIRRLLLARK